MDARAQALRQSLGKLVIAAAYAERRALAGDGFVPQQAQCRIRRGPVVPRIAVADLQQRDLLGRCAAALQQLGHRDPVELPEQLGRRPPWRERIADLFHRRLDVLAGKLGAGTGALAVPKDERSQLSVVPGRNRFQVQRLNVVLNEIVGFSEGLGSRLGILAVGERIPQRQHAAAGTIAGIQHGDLVAGLDQFVGRGESCESRTGDEDLFRKARPRARQPVAVDTKCGLKKIAAGEIAPVGMPELHD